MSTTVIIGTWIAASLTLFIYSFLYKDNVLYKIAESIYIGSSAAYLSVVAWYNIMMPQIIRPLFYGNPNNGERAYILIIPAILGILMLTRFSRKHGWLSRIPMSLIFGMGSGMAITGSVQGIIIPQMNATIGNSPIIRVGSIKFNLDNAKYIIEVDRVKVYSAKSGAAESGITIHEVNNLTSGAHLVTIKDESGKELYKIPPVIVAPSKASEINVTQAAAQVVSPIDPSTLPKLPGKKNILGFPLGNSLFFNLDFFLIFIGVVTTLIYFYFSVPHTGTIGHLARVGIWFIMISFGASFGYTVMARISLLIGRVQFLLIDWLHIIS
jgi:hypothetical protein